MDFFLLRGNGGIIKKYTYFMAWFISNQDFQNTLSLADYIPCQFSDDFPNVNDLYVKSDNTACYHCNFCLESLYKICNKSGIILKQLDFNEARKGKEQCDCDLAMARGFICFFFVDEGKNILTVKDIVNALTTSGINDPKVLVSLLRRRISN